MENEKDRAVTPVVGTVLIVAIVIILASVVAVTVFSEVDQESLDAPQYTNVQITDVEASDGPIEVSSLGVGDECDVYHLVITIEHLGGDDFSSDDLEYRIDAIGNDETISGSFTSSDANPGTTANAGDEIIIALDGDTDDSNCEVDGEFDRSYNGLVFGNEPAWTPNQPEEQDGLGSLHNTFFDDDTDELQEVRVTIIQDSTDTIIIDDETTDIRDKS